MSSSPGFFGRIFDTPGDDPLLQAERRKVDQTPTTSRPTLTSPSWLDADDEVSHNDPLRHDPFDDISPGDDSLGDGLFGREPSSPAPSADHGSNDPSNGHDVMHLDVSPTARAPSALDALNRAIDDGWRLRHIAVAADRWSPAATSPITVTLTRSHPRSLFDFGTG